MGLLGNVGVSTVAVAQLSQAPAPIQSAKVAEPVANQAGSSSLATIAANLSQGRTAEAITALRPWVNHTNEGQRAQSRYLLALALDQQGQPEAALQTLEGSLTDDTPLGKAIGQLRGRLLLQATELALMDNQPDRAAGFLSDYERLSIQPDKARFQRLQYQLRPPAMLVSQAPLRVGVLLPQSGPLAQAGTDVLRALQFGLAEATAGGQRRIELVVRDASTPAATAAAVAELKQEKISLLLGPLLASQVAPVAQALGSIPLLSFSTDATVLGPQRHTLNFLPEQQVATAVRAALADGHRRFAALIPQGPYGEATLTGLKAALAQAPEASLTQTSFYNAQEADIGRSIRTLGKGFDTLLLPATGRNIPLIAAQLAYYDLDRGIQLLGTGLWQDPAVLAPSASATRGSLFAAPARNEAFVATFGTTFGNPPHPLAALGYDAAILVAQLATEQARTGNAIGQLLLRPEGFALPGGYARFQPSGQTERGLSLLEITASTTGSQFTERQNARLLAPLPLPNPLLPDLAPTRWW